MNTLLIGSNAIGIYMIKKANEPEKPTQRCGLLFLILRILRIPWE